MKTILIYKVLLIILIATLIPFISCKKDLQEIERFSSDDMLHENVKVIDSVTIGEPLSIVNNNYTFTSNPELSDLKVGDVIIGQTGKGYIRKIMKITYLSDQIELETEQASLTDAFERLLINDTIKIDFAQMKAYTKTQTAPVKINYIIPNASFKSTAGLINLDNTVLIDESIGNTNVLAKIVEGNINFQPEIIRQLDLSTNWVGIPSGIKSLTIGATGNLSMNFLAEFSIDNNLEYNEEVSLINFDIGPLWMGVVPFYIELGFDAGIIFNAQAAGNIQTGLNSQASVTFGAEYQNEQGWSTLWNKSLEAGQLQTNWTANAASSAIIYVKPSVKVTIASIAGPYMDVKPDLVFDGQINPPTWNYNLISGIDGTLGFKVEIFSFSLADYNTELFRFDKVIASNSGQMTQIATLTTENVINITPFSATTGGLIVSDGGAPITSKGLCYSNSNNQPTIDDIVIALGSGSDNFSGTLLNLTPNQTYFVSAFATNTKGTSYGNVRSFTTSDLSYPQVETVMFSDITESSVIVAGLVSDSGSSAVYARGIVYSTLPDPNLDDMVYTADDGIGSFVANITGLNPGTKYYIKAFASNNEGTGYGTQMEFTTSAQGEAPIAYFSGNPVSGQAPLNVSFFDQSLNSPTEWLWDFGDGNSSTQQNPSHQYISAGNYTVSLTIGNEFGEDTETKNDYITVDEAGETPIADFSANPLNGEAPLNVNFTDQSANNPTEWLWDFGDGNTSTLQNPSHIYQSSGFYTISLIASNEFGEDTETKINYVTVNAAGEAPIANFSANPLNGEAPLNVNFTDQSANNPTEWLWDFGDGNTSTQQNPSHQYTTPGNYTVSLTVSNEFGEDTETKNNYITVDEPGEAPIADFSANPLNGYAPLNVIFTDLSTNDPTEWLWNFGDGNTSTQQNPSHQYTTSGNYTVSLTVSNEFGEDTETKNNYITVDEPGEAPIADFTANPLNGEAPLNVNFTDQSTNDPAEWLWNFGDGNTSTQQHPSHQYDLPGSYTVSLTVSNNFGEDTEVKNNYITVDGTPPVADFSFTPQTGEAPLEVQFIDESTGEIDDWFWDFGDGNTSTMQNPVHTFVDGGTYTLSLTVSNQYGYTQHITYIEVLENSCPPYVSDIDGNQYETIQIGTQCWMKENLKTTRYSNGVSIDFPGSNNDLWNANTTGAYAWYENNISWKNSYGALYNWYATVNNNNLCPDGWHVPTNSEFSVLVSFLGGEAIAGGKMKSTDTEPDPHPRWDSPNNAATNESGFTGYPGGNRAANSDTYGGLGTSGKWWSSTSYNETGAKSRFMHNTAGMIEENVNDKIIGYSVRCVKDQ
ncbi:MAG: PKD domain-containing protein [Bacteroidales bacterium]|nr:PKD domain-containing protein [Bacteroidales bacterium]